KRGQHDPRGNRSVVGPVRRASGDVVVVLALDPVARTPGPARPVGGGDSPAVLAISDTPARVVNRVGLMHVGRLPGVFKVIGAVLAHEPVSEAAEVDPEV